ncbi:MAG: NAD(P)H-hydrate dehydratase [Actinomycetales bacterium]
MPDAPQPTVVTSAVLRRWRLPAAGVGKEARGRVLAVGGSRTTPGAVALAAEAALRAGAGKLQIAVAESAAPVLAVTCPEAMVLGLPEDEDGVIATESAALVTELATQASAVLIGPGMSDAQRTAAFVDRLVPQVGGALVLDAIALAWVTDDVARPGRLQHPTILTPNLAELARTCGREELGDDDHDAVLSSATNLAAASGAVVSAGGSRSTTVSPDGRIWVDETGGTGLGVSGSGDVLAGVVAGLVARGADPAQAAVWGSHLHGRAGDRLAAAVGPLGYLARELVPEIPRVLVELEA